MLRLLLVPAALVAAASSVAEAQADTDAMFEDFSRVLDKILSVDTSSPESTSTMGDNLENLRFIYDSLPAVSEEDKRGDNNPLGSKVSVQLLNSVEAMRKLADAASPAAAGLAGGLGKEWNPGEEKDQATTSNPL